MFLMLINTFFRPFFKYWRNFFNFKGTVSRKFFLISLVEAIVGVMLVSMFFRGLPPVTTIYVFLNYFPLITLITRRIRDTGLSGWLVLLFVFSNPLIASTVAWQAYIGNGLLLVTIVLVILPRALIRHHHPSTN